MKLRVYLLLILLVLLGSQLGAQCNGVLTQNGNKLILHVWGTHYERGYAQGNLLADRFMSLFTNYFFMAVASNSASRYNMLTNYYATHFETDPRFLSEAEGFAAGLVASGQNLWHGPLGRDLGLTDILLVNAVVDMIYAQGITPIELGCSELTSWGVATENDPALQGDPVVTRLLDWTGNTTLKNNALLIVQHPSETDEHKWISFGYPGLMGALSAINDQGQAAFLNIGNIHTSTETFNLDSVLYSVRKGIERYDYDSNGFYDADDTWAAVNADQHISGTLIHNISFTPQGTIAQVIENNNSGAARRFYGDAYSNVAGQNLASTNHFRVLYTPVACTRYDRIQDSLLVSAEMSATRQWTLMGGAGGVSQNMMAIQYIPSTGAILWSVASQTSPAYTQTPLALDTDELFIQPVSVDDETLPTPAFRLWSYPNPLGRQDRLKLSSGNDLSRLEIFNLKGQRVVDQKLSSRNAELSIEALAQPGIYLLKATDISGRTVSRKLIRY